MKLLIQYFFNTSAKCSLLVLSILFSSLFVKLRISNYIGPVARENVIHDRTYFQTCLKIVNVYKSFQPGTGNCSHFSSDEVLCNSL
jgi:hypothetical protein